MPNQEIALAIVYIWLRLRLPEVVQRTLIPSYSAKKKIMTAHIQKETETACSLKRVARVTKKCPCFQVITASWKPREAALVMMVLEEDGSFWASYPSCQLSRKCRAGN